VYTFLHGPRRGIGLIAEFLDSLLQPTSGPLGRLKFGIELIDDVGIHKGVRDPRRLFRI
jgi:hypothetical protein